MKPLLWAVGGLVWLVVATVGGVLVGFAAHDEQRERDRQMEREWSRQWGPEGERE